MKIRFTFKLALLLTLALAFALCAQAQEDKNAKKDKNATTTTATTTTPAAPSVTITASSTPVELARAALASQGGDKYKAMKSLFLKGTANLYGPGQTTPMPAQFAIVISGDRYRRDIQAPGFAFQQITDGPQNYSSIKGLAFPPANKVGPIVLAKFDQTGYTVTAIPDKKSLRGFRIADAEGHTTDFYLDPATGRINTFSFSFEGNTFATEIKSYKEVEGVLVPFEFSEKIETPQGTFYAESKVKDAKLNQPIGNDVFVIPGG